LSAPGPKRNPVEREKDLEETARLYLQGWTQRAIAGRLDVTRQQIGYDLKTLQQRWRESSLRDFDARKAEELAKVDRLEVTHWLAWERSCQDSEVRTVKTTKDADGERTEASKRVEGQVGDPRFLEGVQRCIEQRCKLLGLVVQKVAPTNPDGTKEYGDRDSGPSPELVLARLAAALGGAHGPAQPGSPEAMASNGGRSSP